jgi:hypothetical protein
MYGDGLPASIIKGVEAHFSETYLSAGTSIACVIAAGIDAITLSYVAILPVLLNSGDVEELCAKLTTKMGIERMLRAMSLTSTDRQYSINPIWYWGERKRTWVYVFQYAELLTG